MFLSEATFYHPPAPMSSRCPEPQSVWKRLASLRSIVPAVIISKLRSQDKP